MSLKLHGSIEYVDCELAPTESGLQLKIYLDARFKRDALLVDMPNTRAQQSILVSGKITDPRRAVGVPRDAALCIASFALTTNEFDAPVYVDAGTAHVALGDIHDAITEHGSYDEVIPLILHTADGFEKGKVRLRIDKMHAHHGLRFARPALSDRMERVENELLHYIKSTIDLDESLEDTFTGTRQIRAPYDISESGIESTNGVPLPVVAYPLYEVPESNGAFWDNTLEVVMKRNKLKPDEYWHLNTDDRARIMGQMSAYISQYVDYVSDVIDRNKRHARYDARLRGGYENFGDVNTTWSGDCEDSGAGINACFESLMMHPMDDAHYQEILKDVQHIGSHYVPSLSLDVVHGAQVSDVDGGREPPKGAHLNLMMWPTSTFKKALERTEEGRAQSKKIPWPDATLSSPIQVPFLVEEGTGKLEPLGLTGEDPIARERSIIYSMPSLQGFKKDIMRQRGAPSSFYMGTLLGISNHFIRRGINVGAFIHGTVESGSFTRGAEFTDMINERSDVALLPHPEIPTGVKRTIDEATLLRVPPNKLFLSPPDQVEMPTRNELLDQVTKRFPFRPQDHDSQDIVEVPVYVRPHQLNQQVIGSLIRDLGRVPHLQGVSYELERITDTIHGYRVLFHVSRVRDRLYGEY